MHKQKRIALVMTGGTISTVLSGGVMRPDDEAARRFSEYGFIRMSEPIKILSENLGFSEINKIYNAVKQVAEENDTDAVIVTHGTDSLVYSAAALSLMLCGVNKPIVFVSADYPLSDSRSNGFDNMNGAIKFIAAVDLSGVFVAYKNQGEQVKIHFGSRLNYSRGFDGYVSSATDRICGSIENGVFSLKEKPSPACGRADTTITRSDAATQTNTAAPADNTCLKNSPSVSLDPNNEGRVVLVQPYPGLCYKALAKMQNENGFEIVHDSYHSGTVKTDGDNHIGLLEGSVLIAGGVGGDKYESVMRLKSKGNIRFVDNITPASLYFKRQLSLNMREKERELYLKKNIANEYF